MRPILLFGAGGQVGQELLYAAARSEIPICGITHTQVDITAATAVKAALRTVAPRLVVNVAAYNSVDQAEQEPNLAFQTNASGPRIIAEACMAAKIPLVHISSDYVFDGRKDLPYVEADCIGPLSVYGRSKAAGETAVRQTLEEHLILRTSWVYGAYGRNFVKTVLRLTRERNELRIVADQRGCPTGTTDLVDAILATAAHLVDHDPVWGTYHFAGQGSATWYEFATEVVAIQAAITECRTVVVPISTAEYGAAATRPAYSVLDSSRFNATFGVTARHWRERTRQIVLSLLSEQLITK